MDWKRSPGTHTITLDGAWVGGPGPTPSCERKHAAPDFTSRIFRTGPPPDGDGDIITAWDVLEVSPVGAGACGPSCRTLSAKAATKCAHVACGCGGGRAPALRPIPEMLEDAKMLHARMSEALVDLGFSPPVAVVPPQ